MSTHKSDKKTGSEAVLDALELALERDSRVYLMGEGVADPKGIFGTTVGLVEKFGPKRVIETPVSENGFTGIAIGSAMMGSRPVVIHQRVEFALLAMEQIVNNAAKAHYVSNGKHNVPLVIRLIVGRGWGQGPLHSQSLESLFSYIPGLKVLLPATASDCKGMLLSAVEDDNPVIFLEHRWVHYVKGDVPEGYAPASLDGPQRMWSGKDVTVVASSYMSLESLHAAKTLSDFGINIDLFDLRVARPLVLDRVFESVRRTGKLLVVDTGWQTLGLGAEIVSQVTSACFSSLACAPMRIGLPDHPTPSSRTLAEAYYPQSEHVGTTVCELAGVKENICQEVSGALSSDRQTHPIDVPHPSFQGPF